MSDKIRHVLVLGCGYVGERLAAACNAKGMRVSGTTRSQERAAELAAKGVEAVVVATPADLPDSLLAGVDAVVDSIPLSRSGQSMHAPQLEWLPLIAPKMTRIKWAGYLSTTGVYGDADGAWVDESWPCNPGSPRGMERLRAEQAWLDSVAFSEIFRLAGIYGAGRNILDRLRAGDYRAVQWQPPHYSNRIHVDDIVSALLAAMNRPRPGRIVNLADDDPVPHADYVTELARLIGAPSPVLLTPAEGEDQLSPMALEFFRDNKRVSNRLLHAELLPELAYPGFREGLPGLLLSPDAGL
ncbi:MAG: NAD(P)-dependent oxidoreductase [Zetaproteobacteria bacterium CG12_big_fil_rev_8_21_14_0_65_55_1124]|nr:MAG: NAD(P)-dependent oxidoreductase [Zetaproteobacteria bacterium CG1_02_55_237]PIS19958.1 MAG: NAD(P)-dependent oxidoreductase [Zetaproteobacteria bacterium CG08_land_8_20_14_0_20_55_17]PIW43620.1 MAG: NAD(P)-dependent oxidoreductase [Zetaproteobacteria bacterium CG12_big_fil_rev_8_21_14_0_65_55_1124]PIY52712.1 MAG: NAD(P)-dependent oxidoreductase [Zetaproteobacteria bacterium CG_4_10_14_0_8_um_filter_55_43]PIZ37896.1 MAG: NAD(P)-dependent oxidoreductase [Zetaproteobacteria bacterium CG_4_